MSSFTPRPPSSSSSSREGGRRPPSGPRPADDEAGQQVTYVAYAKQPPAASHQEDQRRPTSARASGGGAHRAHHAARPRSSAGVRRSVPPPPVGLRHTFVGVAPVASHMDVTSSSAQAAAAAAGLNPTSTWYARPEVLPLPPSPKLSYIRGGATAHLPTEKFKTEASSAKGDSTHGKLDSPSARARVSPTHASTASAKSPRRSPAPQFGSDLSPWSATDNGSASAGLTPDDFSATAAIISAYSGDSLRQQMEVDRAWREQRAAEIERERSRVASRSSSRATSRPASSIGPPPARSPPLQTPPSPVHANSAEPTTPRSRPISHSRATSQTITQLPHRSGAPPNLSSRARASFDVTGDEVGRLLAQESRQVRAEEEDSPEAAPTPSGPNSRPRSKKAASVSSDGMTDRGDDSSDDGDDDFGSEAHDEVPSRVGSPEQPSLEYLEHLAKLAATPSGTAAEDPNRDDKEESKQHPPAPSPPPHRFPVSTANMKLSHRLMLEQLYGTKDLTSKNPTTNTAAGTSLSVTTPRRSKLLGLSDGLNHSGQFALGGGVPSIDLAKSLSAPTRSTKKTSDALLVGGSSTVYHPGSRAPEVVLARKRVATLTARSTTPRITQAHNLKRLASGQSVAQASMAAPSSRASGRHEDDDDRQTPLTSTNEWTFLTKLRQEQVRQTEIRQARIASTRASRVDRLIAKAEYSLEEMELRRKQALTDVGLPLYQRLGTALPSSKKTRRPPAQSMFHEVSLTDGVLNRIHKSAHSQYRMSSTEPGGLTQAAEPKLVAWRLDTNAWLTTQNKMIAKQVNLTQVAELRILYDALDDDGSDSLDSSEIATAMRVCGFREDESKPLASNLLEWMGKSRFDCLSFAEFSYAVLHYEIPADRFSSGASRAAFGAVQRMQPLYRVMLESNQRASFSQVVLEFQRHRLYAQAQKAVGMDNEP